MKLMREFRCFLADDMCDDSARNTWAGHPATNRLAPFVVLRAMVEGPVDPDTGYLCNIKRIDELLTKHVAAPLRKSLCETGFQVTGTAVVLVARFEPTARACPQPARLTLLELHASPFMRYAVYESEPSMIELTQSFEFSAAHRLYCKSFSDEENFATFGKCSNPNGHGHNYAVEISIQGEPDARTGVIIPLDRFQKTVNERVIARLDHKHLNQDCIEFSDLNPSVENIACVIWNLLEGHFEPAKLARVRVWETPKTYAEYNGSD